MGDRRVDDSRLGWPADLGEIWKQSGKVLNRHLIDQREVWSEMELAKNRPFKVSLRCLSTALWVARRSAVLARRLGFLFD